MSWKTFHHQILNTHITNPIKALANHTMGSNSGESYTYETAPDKYITANDVKYAYRILGDPNSQQLPLVMNVHFRGTMDHWDPLFINPLATKRPVILIDNAGVGRSEGQVGESYAEWGQCIIDVVLALGYQEVDVLGFSMGGYAAQMIALNGPSQGLKVRKLIIAGSGPSVGEGATSGESQWVSQLVMAKTEEDHRKGFLNTFFSLTPKKQRIGEEWWERMTNARKERSDYVSEEGTKRQLAAVMKWMGPDVEERKNGSYDRLHEIRIPVLVANGSNDVLVPTENSITLWRKLVNTEASLHLYPDSGHGFLDEYHEHFSGLVNDFLDE